MKGIDVSHWQGNIDWSKVNVDFAILKCSGGDAGLYVDAKFLKNKTEARKRGLLLGYYHFAGASDPIKEADFFVNSVGDIAPGEFLCLDFEVKYPSPAVWCGFFLDRVTSKIGFKPLIYINSSTEKTYDWKTVIMGRYPLWIANYGNNDGSIHPVTLSKWKSWVIHQYTSRGSAKGISGNVDLNMADDDLKKYGKPEPPKESKIETPEITAEEPKNETVSNDSNEPVATGTGSTVIPENKSGADYTGATELPKSRKTLFDRILEIIINFINKWTK